MKPREECTCTCHTGDKIIHFVPCCDSCCDMNKEEIIQWIREYQAFRYNVERDMDKIKKNDS